MFILTDESVTSPHKANYRIFGNAQTHSQNLEALETNRTVQSNVNFANKILEIVLVFFANVIV